MGRRPRKYRIHLIDGTAVETKLCKLHASLDGHLLYEEDPSTYGVGIVRTFVMANVKYWEPME